MYIVVYGPEWNHIMYFSDKKKAQLKLFMQMHESKTFQPHMYKYEDDGSGVFKQTQIVYTINKKRFDNLLTHKTIDDINRDFNLVLDTIDE